MIIQNLILAECGAETGVGGELRSTYGLTSTDSDRMGGVARPGDSAAPLFVQN